MGGGQSHAGRKEGPSSIGFRAELSNLMKAMADLPCMLRMLEHIHDSHFQAVNDEGLGD